jgi:hypothetical protein
MGCIECNIEYEEEKQRIWDERMLCKDQWIAEELHNSQDTSDHRPA